MGFGRYGFRPPKPKAKKEVAPVSKLKKLDKLSLDELIKVRNALQKYQERDAEAVALISETIASNQSKRDEYERKAAFHEQSLVTRKTTQIDPLEREIERLTASLEKYRVGFLSSIVSDTIEWRLNNYKKSAGDIIQSIERKEAQLEALKRSAPEGPRYLDLKYDKVGSRPLDYAVITVGGVKTKLEFASINEEQLFELIEQREAEKEQSKTRIKNLRARAAENEGQVRSMSKHDKRKIQAQLDVLDLCPYCGDEMSMHDAHLDHIYPVSKGGKSFEFNLVYVCTSCNMKKRDTLLRTFLQSQDYNEEEVHRRLEKLGKEW